MQKVLNITFRTILHLFTGLIGILLLLLVLLQIPSIQNYLGQKSAGFLASKLKTTVTINKVAWGFFDNVVLKGLYIEDQKNDTLIYAGELNVDLDMLQLFNQEVSIGRIQLINALVNISREEGNKDFNYSFIVKAFEPKDTSKSNSTWQFGVKNIQLRSTSLNYRDVPQAMEVYANLENSSITIKDLGIETQHLVIDETTMEGLNIIVNQTNHSIDTAKTKPAVATGPLWTYTLNDLEIKESHFSYHDKKAPLASKGIDYSHLALFTINGRVENISLTGGNFKAEVHTLALKEKSGLQLQDLKGTISLQNDSLKVLLDKLHTLNTNIHNRLVVTIPTLANIENSLGNISAKADFNEDTLSMDEVYYFIPEQESPMQFAGKRIAISGNLTGQLDDFTFKNALVQVDQNNSIAGNFATKGLPSLNQTYLDLDLDKLNTSSSFIQSFLPQSEELPLNLASLGNIKVKGKVKGYITNLSTDLKASTSIGAVASDMRINMDTSFNLKEYSGKVRTQNFNLGKLLKGNTGLGSITVHSSIKGEGKNIRSFNATVRSAVYNKYHYQNILAEGSLIEDVLKVNVQAKDPNLKAELLAEINMRHTSNTYRVDGKIDTINLHALNFTKDSLILASEVHTAVKGNDIDKMIGSIRLDSVRIRKGSTSYLLDSVLVSADLNNGVREIVVRSPIAEADISGQFTFSELPSAANHLLSHYYSAFETGGKPVHLQSLDFNIQARDLSPIVHFFAPEVGKLDSINISGSFRQESHELKINAFINHLTYQDKEIKNFHLAALADENTFTFQSGASDVAINNEITLQAPEITGSFANDRIEFYTKLHEQTASTRLNLNGILTYSGKIFNLSIPSAELVIDGKEWNLNNENRIRFGEDYLTIQNLELTQGEQRITIHSDDLSGKNTLLNAQLKQVQIGDLSKLVGIVNYKLKGKLNGQLTITDLFNTYGIRASLILNELIVNDQYAGDLTVSATKKTDSELISLNASIKNQLNTASVAASYRMDSQAINADIDIENLSLQLIQPFVKEYVYKLEGNIEADIKATGTIEEPLVIGSVTFKNENIAGLTATRTEYSFTNQKVVFNESAIHFNDFVLYDSLKHKALADGNIYHKRFNDLRFDLKLHSDNFQLLNTAADSEEFMYGTVYAMVDASLSGPMEDLDINLEITTKKNTELFIPLTTKAIAATPEYINYIGIKEAERLDSLNLTIESAREGKDTLKTIEPNIDFSKFNIDGRLNVTTDAKINVVIEPTTGDMIEARGEGNFRLGFTSDNEVNLFGTYTIDEGTYSFTFANLIKRKFMINEGSTISWAGDPEEAALNISGIYKTRASRYELVADQADFMTPEEIDAARLPLPVYVKLKVTGELLYPEISFDIEIPEGNDPMSGGFVTQRINEIKNDPTQLNTQVFGLIVLNKFITKDAISGSTTPGSVAYKKAQQSVTGIINSQLKNLTDDYLSGINLNVNLEALDPVYGAFAQSAQISASKKISDRITVTVGGTTTIGSTQGPGQFAGDYNLLYQLNKSGSVNVKFFRTSTQNIYHNDLSTITGSSVSYRKRFNSWKNIFGKDEVKKDNQSQN